MLDIFGKCKFKYTIGFMTGVVGGMWVRALLANANSDTDVYSLLQKLYEYMCVGDNCNINYWIFWYKYKTTRVVCCVKCKIYSHMFCYNCKPMCMIGYMNMFERLDVECWVWNMDECKTRNWMFRANTKLKYTCNYKFRYGMWGMTHSWGLH